MNMLEELFDMLKENCDGDEKQTIEFANELLDIMLYSKDFISDFSERIEEYAKQNNKCHLCGRELKTKESSEGSEYQGFPVEERINEKYCPNCGYIED